MTTNNRWTKKDVYVLHRIWHDGKKAGVCDEKIIIEAMAALDRTRNSILYKLYRTRLLLPENPKWSKAEVVILNSGISIEEMHKKLPNRTMGSIKAKIRYTQTKLKPKATTIIKKITVKRDPISMIGENSIYDKAAELVGGDYVDGYIKVKGSTLTGKQTLEALARAKSLL
jgi:hypothetical protein